MQYEQYDPLNLQQQAYDNEKSEKDKIFQAQLLNDAFKFVMSDSKGRRFVWAILQQSGVFRCSYTGNNDTFFNEGQRNIGLKLLAELMNGFKSEYALMMQESADE